MIFIRRYRFILLFVQFISRVAPGGIWGKGFLFLSLHNQRSVDALCREVVQSKPAKETVQEQDPEKDRNGARGLNDNDAILLGLGETGM